MSDAEVGYKRVVQRDGIKTTICENRVEFVVTPGVEINEQNVVTLLREWVRWRKNQMRSTGSLSDGEVR